LAISFNPSHSSWIFQSEKLYFMTVDAREDDFSGFVLPL
jgi:hypothetical protein